MNDPHAANKCITNGCYINYSIHAEERFTPQFQLTHCFNCCEYGHRASQCKRDPRCGKCGEKHNIRNCQTQWSNALNARVIMKPGIMNALPELLRATGLMI